MTSKSKDVKPAEHTVVLDQGSSLLPMLIGGLVMITIGMALVVAFA
jgi:hypothetical protein